MGDAMGQGGEPGPLERLGEWTSVLTQPFTAEGAKNRALNAELDQARAKGLASVYATTALPEYLKNHPHPKAWELDKELPRDPRVLKMMLEDPNLDAAAKARVLEVVLLRGGSRPIDELGPALMRNDLSPMEKEAMKHGSDPLGDMASYKTMARDVVLEMKDPQRAEILNELSKNFDHLPDERKPATQLAYILLQDGGGYDKVETRQNVLDAIETLPPDTQGRMLYAIDDAAWGWDKGLGQEPRTSGVSGSLSGGASSSTYCDPASTFWRPRFRRSPATCRPQTLQLLKGGPRCWHKSMPLARGLRAQSPP
jgi:hypothetical protein